jgi:xanthine/CO dehydrogenase XdhC/CoxF family maturation factor
MSRIGCREVYFIKATQSHQVDFLIDRVREVVKEMRLPPEYDIRIYKNVYSCCGVGGLGVIIEVVGPEEEQIKAVDLRAMSRILEFCEKEGYDVGHHSLGQYESL